MSRRRILEAAMEIAAERGYDGTTVAQITKKTGLPSSSVYWQFGNKDQLLAEALDFGYESWFENGPTYQPDNHIGAAADRIRTRFSHLLTSIQREPGFWRLGLMVCLLRRPEKIAAQERFRQVRRKTSAIIEAWWRDMLPTDVADEPVITGLLTSGYLSLVDGLFVAHRANPDLDLDRFGDVISQALTKLVEKWTADPSAIIDRISAHEPLPVKAYRRRTAADSRTRIVLAAADIAAERGYRGTTIMKVCKQAELPYSSVYWFFADKDELLAEVVQMSWEQWLSLQAPWPQPDPNQPMRERLHEIIEPAVRTLTRAPSFLRIGHMLTLEQHNQEITARARYLGMRSEMNSRVADWFEKSLDDAVLTVRPDLPQILAEMVVTSTDGFFLATQIDRGQRPTTAITEFIVDLVEGAVAATVAAGEQQSPAAV